MMILIDLSSHLMSELLSNYLKKDLDGHEAHETYIANGTNGNGGFRPDIILADMNKMDSSLFSLYPESKVVLFDTGLKQDDIINLMLSYKIDGVISAHTSLSHFKKALAVIHQGHIWIENSTVKAVLHSAGLLSRSDKINLASEKENEIIKYVCQGCSNKEIASKLSVSEQTVKAHLNRIFRKFNVSSRFQLITLSFNNRSTPQG